MIVRELTVFVCHLVGERFPVAAVPLLDFGDGRVAEREERCCLIVLLLERVALAGSHRRERRFAAGAAGQVRELVGCYDDLRK